MSKYVKDILIVISCVILLGTGYWAYQIWKSAEKSAEHSCLGSIHTIADAALRSGKFRIDGKPRELTKEEIMQLLTEHKPSDCYRRKYMFDNLHISIGEVNSISNSKVKVWTSGADEIAGTEDDLMVPWNEKAQ